MNHPTDKIQAWLSGELEPAAAAALENHLRGCPDCAREADQARKMWDLLGELESASTGGSVWPAVRERTFGSNQASPWFFGNGALARSFLAASALAAGLILGVVLPGTGTDRVGGQASALSVAADQVEVAWLNDTSWGGEATELEASWLTAGQEETTDQDPVSPEEAR